jgi:hypothetical protein
MKPDNPANVDFFFLAVTKKCNEARMEMHIPKGMRLRGSIWWARKDVPANLRSIVGVTSLQRTLGTSDLREAIIRFHGVMGEFERTINEARKKLRGEVPDVDEPLVITPMGYDGKPIRIRRSTKPSKSMEAIFDQWMFEKKPTPNTEAEYRKAMKASSR